MKERTEELRNCNTLLEAEIRSEEEECNLVKKKLLESDDKLQKLKTKFVDFCAYMQVNSIYYQYIFK